jgi:hypothetical protein
MSTDFILCQFSQYTTLQTWVQKNGRASATGGLEVCKKTQTMQNMIIFTHGLIHFPYKSN